MLASIRIVGLFVLAALCEVGGAYLVWQWQRTGKTVLYALFGIIALFIYSLIQTTQTFGFGRTFAAYGGIFILVALLWGWLVDKQVPSLGLARDHRMSGWRRHYARRAAYLKV